MLWKFQNNFDERFLNFFRAVQKSENLVDLEKCWKIALWLPKLASIQPRTSWLALAVGADHRSPANRQNAETSGARGQGSEGFGAQAAQGTSTATVLRAMSAIYSGMKS